MSALSMWLNDHKYKLLNTGDLHGICKIRDVVNGSKKMLKIMDISELDQKVVQEVVSKMIVINELEINGLMKYKVIEVSGDSLYRICREYKVHLEIINPIKYFEDIGVFEVLNGILNVLKVLNINGMFHNDLKPSNVFLNDENEVIIGDYLNNLLYKGREVKRNMKVEDICFVCIDELCGLELDISSDIWNFGLIFYYVLSGKYPFVGSNISKTLLNILNVKYDQIEREYESKKLNYFLSRILIKEKRKRLNLDEIEKELKKLNEVEIPAIPFEEEEVILKMPIEEEEKTVISEKLNNSLTSNGLKIFSKCLKFFPNLETLIISCNKIDDEGVEYLCENLNEIPKLKQLYLDSNLISDIGGDILINCLRKCKELNYLEMLGNVISKKEEFIKRMKEKHRNKSMDIRI